MPRLRIHRQSAAEFTEVLRWYAGHSVWAAENFHHAFWSALERLRVAPTAHAYWRQPFRRVRLKRFPYLLIYHADERYLSVVALIHDRREPRRASGAISRRLDEFT